MNETYNILIDGCSNIEHLIGCLERFAGHGFVKSQNVPWNLYQTNILGVHISVFDNQDFENDQGIEFERFSFVIDMTGSSGYQSDTYYNKWLDFFPLLLASNISKELNCECMVVIGFQHIIKSFFPLNDI